MMFEHPDRLYPKPIPRKREVLIYREGDARFSKALGLEYCVLPETTRTEDSVQLHIKDISKTYGCGEYWLPLGYRNKLHRATGRNMEITDDIVTLRAQILELEKEIRKKLASLQDEITPENIGKYFTKEENTELERTRGAMGIN